MSLAALVALLVAGCGKAEPALQSSSPLPTPQPVKACDQVGDIDGEPKAKLPADVPLPGDWHVYESEGPFGKTTRYFAVTDGGPDDLPQRRDDASDILVENGYKLLSKDQEEGAEAEAHLNGKHTVDIQVISLCEGKLRIRYTVS